MLGWVQKMKTPSEGILILIFPDIVSVVLSLNFIRNRACNNTQYEQKSFSETGCVLRHFCRKHCNCDLFICGYADDQHAPSACAASGTEFPHKWEDQILMWAYNVHSKIHSVLSSNKTCSSLLFQHQIIRLNKMPVWLILWPGCHNNKPGSLSVPSQGRHFLPGWPALCLAGRSADCERLRWSGGILPARWGS